MLRAVSVLALLQAVTAIEPEVAVAAAPAGQQGANESEAGLARQVEGELHRRAESAIGGLQRLEGDLQSSLANESHLSDVVESIIAKAELDYHDRRQEAERELQARIQTLETEALHPANYSMDDVTSALSAAKEAAHVLSQLTSGEFKAMRQGLDQRYKAERARARILFKEAREALKQMQKFGRQVAKALRKAGTSRGEAERAGLESELDAEKLGVQAELASERAEDLAEEHFEALEAKLESRMEELQDAAESERMAHEDRLRQAQAAIEKVKGKMPSKRHGEDEEDEEDEGHEEEALRMTALRGQSPTDSSSFGSPVTVLYVSMGVAVMASAAILVTRPMPAPVLGHHALG